MTTDIRHLSAALPSAPILARVTPPQTSAHRVRLSPWQRMEAEQTRKLVDSLAELDAADLTPVKLAFVLGRLHGSAANLLDILDAITEL
jgi:hypothetical protein